MGQNVVQTGHLGHSPAGAFVVGLQLGLPGLPHTAAMAEGDYHVEKKRGAWQLEQEGSRKTHRIQVEQLASREQAWYIALFYAKSAAVDVFLHEEGRVTGEKLFRVEPRRRGR